MKGWKGSVAGVKDMADLPIEAKRYVKRIEKLIECKVILVSTSPERSDTILLENPFQYK
jgi:adenylosuccinate synthase